MTFKKLREGVWAVVATPFYGQHLHVDESSLVKEVEHSIGAGADGLVVLGVFGEATSLTSVERETVIRVVTQSAGSVPVVVGLTSQSTAPAVEEAQRAREAATGDLAGLMVQANSSDLDVLEHHVGTVAHQADCGIVIQHYPAANGVSVSPENLAHLARSQSSVVAVKCESTPTLIEIGEVSATSQVPAFGGLGATALLDELAVGSAGAMTGFSFPDGLVACVEQYRRRGMSGARVAWSNFMALANFEFQPGFGLAIRKESLRRRGIIREAEVRPPAREMPERFSQLLQEHLDFVCESIDTDREFSDV